MRATFSSTQVIVAILLMMVVVAATGCIQEDDCEPGRDARCEGSTTWNCGGGPGYDHYVPKRWYDGECPSRYQPGLPYCAVVSVSDHSDEVRASCTLTEVPVEACASDGGRLNTACVGNLRVTCRDGFPIQVLRDCSETGQTCVMDSAQCE